MVDEDEGEDDVSTESKSCMSTFAERTSVVSLESLAKQLFGYSFDCVCTLDVMSLTSSSLPIKDSPS